MLRILGCLMMIVTGSLCGITKSKAVRAHTAELKTVCSMLREISELIRYKRSTTDEILSLLSADSRFSSLAAGRSEHLSCEEKSLLSGIFAKLGTTDAEGQFSMIEHGASRFAEYAEDAAAEQKNKCRLYEVLGFMGGAFAAVIFI